MFFWNSLAFLMVQWTLAIWWLLPLAFLNSSWTSGSSQFTVEACPGEFWVLLCWRVRWVERCGSLSILWHCLSLGLEWKLTFSSPVATAAFSIFAGILNASLTASSIRVWNSWTGISSPPLALFTVNLPKAHLTLHSRMSGSKWVITPSWLSGSLWSFFVQFFCVFLPPLLNIFCFC